MARKDPTSHLNRPPPLPPRLVEEILALGRPGLERLVGLVEDRTRWQSEPVAVANALEVLGRAADPVALPAALAVYAEAELDSPLYAAAGSALRGLVTADNYTPLLAAPLDGPRQDDATAVLVGEGVRDPALLPRLEALLGRDPARGARLCARYGDPALGDALQACFERLFAEANDDSGPCSSRWTSTTRCTRSACPTRGACRGCASP